MTRFLFALAALLLTACQSVTVNVLPSSTPAPATQAAPVEFHARPMIVRATAGGATYQLAQCVVVTAAVNGRMGPGTDYPAVTWRTRGDKIMLLPAENGWRQSQNSVYYWAGAIACPE